MRRMTYSIVAALLLTGLSGMGSARADDNWRSSGHMHGHGWHTSPGHGPMGPGYGPMGPAHDHMGPGYGGMAPGHGPMAPGYGSRGPGGSMRGLGVGQLDTSDDGVISDGEAAQHFEGRFVFLDADSDGVVTKDEFLRFRPPFFMGDREALEKQEKRYETRLKTMDSNKDSKVSKAEYMGFHRKQFAAADANKDGKVDVWEYRSQRRR